MRGSGARMTCGEHVWFTVEEKEAGEVVLTVEGEGETSDGYVVAESPFAPYADVVTDVVIGDGVSEIGGCAFRGFGKLARVSFGKGVKILGVSCFSECAGLTEVTLPEGLRVIGPKAFEKCVGIQKLWLPSTLKSIDFKAFYGDDAVTDVYFGGTLKEWRRVRISSSGRGNATVTGAEIHTAAVSSAYGRMADHMADVIAAGGNHVRHMVCHSAVCRGHSRRVNFGARNCGVTSAGGRNAHPSPLLERATEIHIRHGIIPIKRLKIDGFERGRQPQLLNAYTFFKCLGSDHAQPLRKRDLCKPCALRKAADPQNLYAFSEADTCKLSEPAESTSAYLADTVADHHIGHNIRIRSKGRLGYHIAVRGFPLSLYCKNNFSRFLFLHGKPNMFATRHPCARSPHFCHLCILLACFIWLYCSTNATFFQVFRAFFRLNMRKEDPDGASRRGLLDIYTI